MRLTQLWMEYAAAACIGFLIDFIVGDPQGLWHDKVDQKANTGC